MAQPMLERYARGSPREDAAADGTGRDGTRRVVGEVGRRHERGRKGGREASGRTDGRTDGPTDRPTAGF